MLLKLAVMFRVLNIYAHHGHNMIKGKEFFQDHAFLNELYDFADSSYDSIIERHIGTIDDKIDLGKIIKQVSLELDDVDQNYLSNCLIMINEILLEIEGVKSYSSGTINLVQGIADDLEVFVFKLKRRI